MTAGSLARRSAVRLRADPTRVAAGYFVAGEEAVGATDSRAPGVVERVLALDEDVVVARLDDLRSRFRGRHRDLEARFSSHADRISGSLDPEAALSEERWLLLGAAFTAGVEHRRRNAPPASPVTADGIVQAGDDQV